MTAAVKGFAVLTMPATSANRSEDVVTKGNPG